MATMSTMFFLLLVGQVAIATSAKQAPQFWIDAVYGKITGVTADEVWPLFQDFCNIYKFFPLASSFCSNGDLPAGHIGQMRYITTMLPSPVNPNTTYIRWEHHNLTAIDPVNQKLTYTIMDNNVGVKFFNGTMYVLPTRYGCDIVWSYFITPVVGFTRDSLRTIEMAPLYAHTARNIEAYFKTPKNI